MKLRKGEHIVCSKGHHAGRAQADVSEGESVSPEALLIDGNSLPGIDQGWQCKRCGEPVAMLLDDTRWRVRTSRGWIA